MTTYKVAQSAVETAYSSLTAIKNKEDVAPECLRKGKKTAMQFAQEAIKQIENTEDAIFASYKDFFAFSIEGSSKAFPREQFKLIGSIVDLQKVLKVLSPTLPKRGAHIDPFAMGAIRPIEFIYVTESVKSSTVSKLNKLKSKIESIRNNALAAARAEKKASEL
ncbi:MAG: hypothetical protein L7U87_07765 [Chlamydiales bacterium]|nr:hypothetical protein [Chlamydiales bacterium]